MLTDECLPAGLKESVASLGHEAETVRRAGYGAKKNGELLSLMEGRWDVLLTNDRNIQYQQNMSGRNVSILILCAKSNRIKDLLPLMPACAEVLLSITPAQIVEVGPLWANGRGNRLGGRIVLLRQILPKTCPSDAIYAKVSIPRAGWWLGRYGQF